ncbi:MAG: hypothetical protein IJU61_08515, partial [Victivallales bacterium]|nr:hypothetical protein [Victivallales bacterium]
MMIPKAETMPENHVSAIYKNKICGNEIFSSFSQILLLYVAEFVISITYVSIGRVALQCDRGIEDAASQACF